MSPSAIDKPVLFVTGHAPFDRVGAFARLHEREGVEYALFGGRAQHGGLDAPGSASGLASGLLTSGLASGLTSGPALPFPHRHVRQRELARVAASGRHRAVVVSTSGRVALPAAWAGARRAGVPVILWSALWAHPRTPAHAFSWLALRRLYHTADAVVAYGSHVEAYARAGGARNVHVARQAVDNDFWSAADVRPPAARAWPSETTVTFLFAGRPLREKGVGVLMQAWSDSGLLAPSAALVLVGVGSTPPWIPADGAVWSIARRARHTHGGASTVMPGNVLGLDPVPPARLRDLYADADVLVVPSIATRTFREPWGLVVNEAMNRNLPVIATDAVGAVAGGLVRHDRNGLVVPAGDAHALA
ncbi:MAG TPA: glycosyltransferase family 4 protein, partial [Solirubrobacteraceae bacterium]|nr:glycosyltransferase family 4 protein [Solirubrobacteraceae bacterium]